MEIHQLAANSVAIKGAEGVVALNPPEKGKKNLTPDVIVGTYAIPVAGWSEMMEPEPEQKKFLGAGEYEKNGIYLQGCDTKTQVQKQEIQTTSWYIEMDGVRALILGDIEKKDEALKTLAELESVDILIPLCTETKEKRMSATDIVGIAATLETKRIVPIGDDETMKKNIAKEAGDAEEVSGKYTVKKKDLAEDRVKVVLLN